MDSYIGNYGAPWSVVGKNKQKQSVNAQNMLLLLFAIGALWYCGKSVECKIPNKFLKYPVLILKKGKKWKNSARLISKPFKFNAFYVAVFCLFYFVVVEDILSTAWVVVANILSFIVEVIEACCLSFHRNCYQALPMLMSFTTTKQEHWKSVCVSMFSGICQCHSNVWAQLEGQFRMKFNIENKEIVGGALKCVFYNFSNCCFFLICFSHK